MSSWTLAIDNVKYEDFEHTILEERNKIACANEEVNAAVDSALYLFKTESVVKPGDLVTCYLSGCLNSDTKNQVAVSLYKIA